MICLLASLWKILALALNLGFIVPSSSFGFCFFGMKVFDISNSFSYFEAFSAVVGMAIFSLCLALLLHLCSKKLRRNK